MFFGSYALHGLSPRVEDIGTIQQNTDTNHLLYKYENKFSCLNFDKTQAQIISCTCVFQLHFISQLTSIKSRLLPAVPKTRKGMFILIYVYGISPYLKRQNPLTRFTYRHFCIFQDNPHRITEGGLPLYLRQEPCES